MLGLIVGLVMYDCVHKPQSIIASVTTGFHTLLQKKSRTLFSPKKDKKKIKKQVFKILKPVHIVYLICLHRNCHFDSIYSYDQTLSKHVKIVTIIWFNADVSKWFFLFKTICQKPQ